MDTTISQRELRNDSGEIMRRVEQGETFTVTRNGTPVADLVPHDAGADRRRRFVAVQDIAAGAGALADWGAGAFDRELRELERAIDDDDIDSWQAR
jgi:prevent-host-death family protein